MNDRSRRKRIPFQQTAESFPRRWPTPFRPAEPFPPGPFHFVPEPRLCGGVAGYSIIGEVPTKLLAQCLMLLDYRSVTVYPTPRCDCLQCPVEPVPGRLPLHHPVSLPRAAPVVGEVQRRLGLGDRGVRAELGPPAAPKRRRGSVFVKEPTEKSANHRQRHSYFGFRRGFSSAAFMACSSLSGCI